VISQTAEYALRAMMCLAASPDHPQTTQEIADQARIPSGYLSKVLQSLGRAGLVDSFRGLGGGFLLTRRPEELTIFEIIQAVDPLQRIRTCPLDVKAHSQKLCPLHRRLDEAMAMVEKAFRESTIAELLEAPDRSRPLCYIPRAKRKASRY